MLSTLLITLMAASVFCLAASVAPAADRDAYFVGATSTRPADVACKVHITFEN